MTMTQAANSYYDTEIGTTVTVVFLDLDTGVDEQVIFNSAADCYTILLNSRCSDEAMRIAFDHARGHILNGDFEKDQVQRIEAYAHGLAVPEEPITVEEPVPEKPKRKQTREDALSLAECHKRVEAEWAELRRQNMIAMFRKRQAEYDRQLEDYNRKRKSLEETLRRSGLYLEDRIVDDEYGCPVCRPAICADEHTVFGYWNP